MLRRLSLISLAVAAALVGCRKPPPRPDAPTPRIVSFSPAITGMCFEMGLGKHIVGVTTFCRLPDDHQDIPVVGDRARVSCEAILAVQPDICLIQQNPADFAAVSRIDPELQVEHFTIETLADISAAITRIGKLAGRDDLASRYSSEFEGKLEAVRIAFRDQHRPKVLFLLGYERPSTGGNGTFISEMIDLAGGTNAAASSGYSGWKMLNRENIQAMAPEVLICQVSPGQERQAEEYWQTLSDVPAVRLGRVHLVTDSRWTVPSIWSAGFAENLAGMLHAETKREGALRD